MHIGSRTTRERRDQDAKRKGQREREKERRKEREGGKERGKKTEDCLHIKWTGNEPGYIESVGKSVCRGASLCKVCPPFLLGVHFVYIEYTLVLARANADVSYTQRRGC